MRAYIWFVLAAFLAIGSPVMAQLLLTGVGTGGVGAGGGGGYTGPGDSSVVGAAVAFWATFSCYTAAYSGNAMDVVDAATQVTTGSRVTCSGGTATVSSSSSACTFLTGSTVCSPLATTCASACNVRELYDQSGANSCGGNPCNLVYGSDGPTSAPPLTLSALSTFPCVTSRSGSLGYLVGANNVTQAQPFSVLMVSKRVSGTADVYAVMRSSANVAGNIRAGYSNSANTATIYAGDTFPSVTASDGHFHDMSDVFNTTTSNLYVDGSSNPVSLGTGTASWSGSDSFALFGIGTTTVATVCEIGVWNGDIGATKAGNYNTNVVTRYGTLP